MYYTVSIYPQIANPLADAIRSLRQAYDPTAGFTRPHITVLFPVPGRVGENALTEHIRAILRDRRPFDLELSSFRKSRDHWLFLTPDEGTSQLKDMYCALYSGLLAEFRRDDIEYIPHVSLGHFLKPGAIYDWNHPREADFERDRFAEAMEKARTFPLPSRVRVDTLHMTKLPDEIIDWATGKRRELPADPETVEVRQFRLESVTS